MGRTIDQIGEPSEGSASGKSENSAQAHKIDAFSLEDGQAVQLPHADFVRNSDILRDGQDLTLELEDGSTFTVQNYYSLDTSPVLNAPDGTSLTQKLVNSFVQNQGHSEYAQSATMADASPVGAVEEVSGTATLVRADGSITQLTIGEPLFQGDIIQTQGDGAVKIMFIDESTFAVSENAKIAIDKFQFDDGSDSGATDFSVVKGVFMYTSGLIGRDDPDDVHIETPQGSIGIRGTTIAGNVDKGEITVLDGAIVLRTPGGDEVTLANQFETAQFNGPDGGIEYKGIKDAAEFQQDFASIKDVSADIFNSFDDNENRSETEKEGKGEGEGEGEEAIDAEGREGEEARESEEANETDAAKEGRSEAEGEEGLKEGAEEGSEEGTEEAREADTEKEGRGETEGEEAIDAEAREGEEAREAMEAEANEAREVQQAQEEALESSIEQKSAEVEQESITQQIQLQQQQQEQQQQEQQQQQQQQEQQQQNAEDNNGDDGSDDSSGQDDLPPPPPPEDDGGDDLPDLSVIEGTDGDDFIVSSSDNQQILTFSGEDDVIVQNDSVLVNTGANDDQITVNATDFEIRAGSGNDFIDLRASSSFDETVGAIRGGDGIDTILLGGPTAWLFRGENSATDLDIAGIANNPFEGTQTDILIENIESIVTDVNVADFVYLAYEESFDELRIVALDNESPTVRDFILVDMTGFNFSAGQTIAENATPWENLDLYTPATESLLFINSFTNHVGIIHDAGYLFFGTNEDDILDQTGITINNARYNLYEGNNYLALEGDSNVIRTSSGNNQIRFRGDDYSVETGAGDDFIDARDGETADIITDDGNDEVQLRDYEDATVETEDGEDTVTLQNNSNFNTIITGAGDDIVELADSLVNSIDTGAGDDIVELADSQGNNVNTGADNDTVVLEYSLGNVIDTGEGIDSVELFDSSDNVIETGAGGDTVTIEDFGSARNNTINTGDQADFINILGGIRNTINAGNNLDQFILFTADYVGRGDYIAHLDGDSAVDRIIIREIDTEYVFSSEGNTENTSYTIDAIEKIELRTDDVIATFNIDDAMMADVGDDTLIIYDVNFDGIDINDTFDTNGYFNLNIDLGGDGQNLEITMSISDSIDYTGGGSTALTEYSISSDTGDTIDVKLDEAVSRFTINTLENADIVALGGELFDMTHIDGINLGGDNDTLVLGDGTAFDEGDLDFSNLEYFQGVEEIELDNNSIILTLDQIFELLETSNTGQLFITSEGSVESSLTIDIEGAFAINITEISELTVGLDADTVETEFNNAHFDTVTVEEDSGDLIYDFAGLGALRIDSSLFTGDAQVNII